MPGSTQTSDDQFSIAPEPYSLAALPTDPASGTEGFMAGVKFATDQAGTVIRRLELENERLAERNEELATENARQREEHRDRLADIDREHAKEIKKAEKEARDAKDALREMTVDKKLDDLRAEFDKQKDGSMLDRVMEPLIQMAPALMQQFGGPDQALAPVAVEVEPVHVGPHAAHGSTTVHHSHPEPAATGNASGNAPGSASGAGSGAPYAARSADNAETGRDAAAPGGTHQASAEAHASANAAPQPDPNDPAVIFRTLVEPKLVRAVLGRAIGQTEAGSVLSFLANVADRFGLSPTPQQLGHAAISAVLSGHHNGIAPAALANALAPVVEAQTGVANVLRTSSDPAVLVDAVWGMVGFPLAELTAERRPYVVDVLRALATELVGSDSAHSEGAETNATEANAAE